ncbi:hypothetical protein [Sinirhodobacter huangdaonensis]|uniref:Uncharacterized protein n=1 Tax=Paenirhodobacter huangdaonensis TaxID=2501515 RepID=A0A3S3M0A0_9RHOB|nr:hypothetical protein [Sinirhodobacter huangdaonensis]RWR53336.1 hypothetical protein EOW66_06395 [Sinirhodobacter huangdaonensis]
MGDAIAIRVLMQHLEVNEEAAAVWVDYIENLTFGHDPVIYDLKRDVENLENLERALNLVLEALDFGAMTQAARDDLGRRLIWGPHTDTLISRSGEEASSFDLEILSYPEKVGRKAADSLQALEDNFLTIRGAIRSTKRHIEKSPSARIGTGRINFSGIQLVKSAREVWRFATGNDAPNKALNPASRFGKFLCDLFEAFEIGGDPRAAFRAWAATQ